MNGMSVFCGNANQKLAEDICQRLSMPITEVLVGRFSEGEIRVQIKENIRGKDVFIIQPTCPPTNENLMELLILIDAARRASAKRITAVIPYYGYARQDRKDQPRVPITAKLVANLIYAAGTNRVLCMDMHDFGFFGRGPAFVNNGQVCAQTFRIGTGHFQSTHIRGNNDHVF